MDVDSGYLATTQGPVIRRLRAFGVWRSMPNLGSRVIFDLRLKAVLVAESAFTILKQHRQRRNCEKGHCRVPAYIPAGARRLRRHSICAISALLRRLSQRGDLRVPRQHLTPLALLSSGPILSYIRWHLHQLRWITDRGRAYAAHF